MPRRTPHSCSAGYLPWGKPSGVSPCLPFTKSRWGVLGSQGSPGGIVYLDVSFDQPAHCRIQSADIVVTLEDGEPQPDVDDAATHGSAVAHFTDLFGPPKSCSARRAGCALSRRRP